MPGKNSARHAGIVTGAENRLTYPDSTASTPADEESRCLACRRPLTAAKSVARGYGPACFTREANRQRAERAEALHARLRDLLRRLPDLDVRGLAVVQVALDGAVDALDGLGGAL